MTVFNQEQHWDAFLLREGNGYISREKATVEAAQVLKPGAVVGVVTATGDIKEYNPANVDGSEVVAGVLLKDADATTLVVEATYIARLAEVNQSELVWFSGATVPQIATGEEGLKALSIVPRQAA